MITIFTGAGASRPLGFPTTAEFFENDDGKALQKDPVYAQVRDYLNTSRKEKKVLLDVEDVLKLVSPFADLAKTDTGKFLLQHLGGNWIAHIPDFEKDTKDACFKHYGKTLQREQVQKLYLPLLKSFSWHDERVSIFTTNYDRVTDELLDIAEAEEIACYDGFKGRGAWAPQGYSKLKTPSLGIYRLHGSLGWVKEGNIIKNSRDYSLRAPGYAEHLLIYPGFKGNPERGDEEVFRFPHEQLKRELGETSRLLVIGFSFRDPHLNEMFRDALADNQNLIMVVWNPCEWPENPDLFLPQLKERFGERIVHLKANFGDDNALEKLKGMASHNISGTVGCLR